MRVLLALCALVALSRCAPPPEPEQEEPIDLGDPDCDPLVPVECALPWPSNLYLVEDPGRRTGYTLRFGRTSLPATKKDNTPVSPDDYRRLDGYSVGTPLMVVFPDVDISQMPGEEQIARSLDPDAQLVWLEVRDGTVRRVPYWVELDAYESDPARQVLFVRPAVILREATRYVVAFRNLRDRSGAPIAPWPAFARLRDGKTRTVPALAARQRRFDEVFALLESQGVQRASLTLAWDFVTASSEALHGDLLAMRDDALRRTGPMGPPLTVTQVTRFAPTDDGSGRPVSQHWAVEIEGTYEVPDYLAPWTLGALTGNRIRRDAMGRPLAMGTRSPRFWVRIPHSAVGGPPHGLVMYGHGLLGSGTQVRGDFNGRIANDHRFIFFAADLLGLAEEDVPLVILTLQELSRFPSMAERLQQGLVQWVLLARAMRARLPELLRSHPTLQTMGIRINQDELYYSGISQGGIMGASFLALTPDITYGHFGVPGNNYSTLLQRSVNFDRYAVILNGAYNTPTEQAILLAAIQLLWDSTDPVTHLRHITAEPYPGNRPHYGLWAPARGDYQVAVVTNEIAARSDIGIALMEHYDDERTPALIQQTRYPHRGSGVVLYNFGNPWPPPGNRPPRDMLGDPHGKPRWLEAHNRQMAHFFRTGEIIDVCGGDGCRPD
ncbi:MAG: hypothetical protein RMK29_17930 [Myxococcales bacterium]|nr:hypothetical protein [Myxococcota bacterium]MDW8283590.1 hypothetical protein [Myxococcales bacterium]